MNTGEKPDFFEIKGELVSPIVGHIPHSSAHIPNSVRADFALDEEALDRELLQITDHHTDELFSELNTSGKSLVYGVSRLVCDPERFWEDEKEAASKSGFGVVYEKTCDGKLLRKRTRLRSRKELLQTYYFPYHTALERLVKECLEKFGRCLIIDCHSFPSKPLPYETGDNSARPDICIGSDEVHSPNALVQEACKHFQEALLDVSVNKPFSGSIVPSTYYGKPNTGVHSIMVEVNRKLYMREDTGEKNEDFERIQAIINGFLMKMRNAL